MLGSVTQMNTAKTTSTPVTITDCARATNRAPTRFTATMTMTSPVMKMLSQAAPALSPTNSDVA